MLTSCCCTLDRWTTHAHVLFIDSLVGVGFSHTTDPEGFPRWKTGKICKTRPLTSLYIQCCLQLQDVRRNFKPEVKIALLKTTRPWLRKSKQKWGNQVKKFTLFSLASEVIFRLDFCLEATIVVKLLVSFCYLTCTYFRSIGLVSLVANYLWLF